MDTWTRQQTDANWLNLSIHDTLLLAVALATLKIDWKYSEVKKGTLGLSGGKDKLAVIRASGDINRVEGSLRHSLKIYAKMWKEMKLLAEYKHVVASMVDVAASGGYYMEVAADAIVFENRCWTLSP
ncbi:serine protease SPPA, chloroplastic [Tanacetum coccineum]